MTDKAASSEIAWPYSTLHQVFSLMYDDLRAEVAHEYPHVYSTCGLALVTRYYPFRHGYMFCRPIDPAIHPVLEQDVLVFIQCNRRNRSIKCDSYITDENTSFSIDGPVFIMSEVVGGIEDNVLPPGLTEWIEQTKRFVLGHSKFIVDRLRELEVGG